MPNLTVPNIMVALVAGIGIYAGYRLVKNKMEDVKPAGSGEGELVLLGNPLKLSANRYYRGRLRVRETGAEPFLAASGRETLAGALKILGFSNVKVWMEEDELPSGWPSSTKKDPTPLTRWFEGQWRNPSTTLPRPEDIEAIWIAKPPAGATYSASISGEPCPPGKDCGCSDCGSKDYMVTPAIVSRGPYYFNSSYADEMMG